MISCSRLHEIIRALGYEPGKDEPAAVDRTTVLADLDAGKISFEDAMKLLEGGD